MDSNTTIISFTSIFKQYAKDRKSEVERGAETPRLAALLLQKYGYGMCDSLRLFIEKGPRNDLREALNELYKLVDQEVECIDPTWREHAKERWSGRPSDIISFPDKKES